MRSLILIDHEAQQAKRPSLHAISAAQKFSQEYDLLVLGHELAPVAESLRGYGASTVIVVDNVALADPLADRYAATITRVADEVGASTILGASSTFTKDILPRMAALWDAPMLSDVVAIDCDDDQLIYTRPMYAGSALAQVALLGTRRVLTIRSAAFALPEPDGEASPVANLPLETAELPSGMQFVSRAQRASDRPDLSDARVVVAGGRPLKDRETFDRIVTALADTFGGAVGATRAAVDAGIVPNDWQIGQTGKVIAPDLYVAVGISGAIQHLAGIKDSRVIVAINKDPQAPIFDVATYALVGDLHQIMPELLGKLTKILEGRG